MAITLQLSSQVTVIQVVGEEKLSWVLLPSPLDQLSFKDLPAPPINAQAPLDGLLLIVDFPLNTPATQVQ